MALQLGSTTYCDSAVMNHKFLESVPKLNISGMAAIANGTGCWGVCQPIGKGRITTLVTIHKAQGLYHIYSRSMQPNIPVRVGGFMRVNQDLDYALLDDDFNSCGFILAVSSQKPIDYVPTALTQVVVDGSSLMWTPQGRYAAIDGHEIPYLLVSILTREQRDEFYSKFSVMREAALNFLLSNLPHGIYEILKGIETIPPFSNSSTVITEMWRASYDAAP